jgi:hypothetical protein
MPLYPEHIPVVLAQGNPYDYTAFLATCKEKQLLVLSMNDFLDGVKKLLPNISISENLIRNVPGRNNTRCGSCGGGSSGSSGGKIR